jgi:hypothetical protein
LSKNDLSDDACHLFFEINDDLPLGTSICRRPLHAWHLDHSGSWTTSMEKKRNGGTGLARHINSSCTVANGTLQTTAVSGVSNNPAHRPSKRGSAQWTITF